MGLLAPPLCLGVADSTVGLIGLFERGAVYPRLVGQVIGACRSGDAVDREPQRRNASPYEGSPVVP